MRNMGDYRDLYLNTDDLLLVNVFDESKNVPGLGLKIKIIFQLVVSKRF